MNTSYLDVLNISSNSEVISGFEPFMRVPSAVIPPAGAQLWRFMDFPKLLSILDVGALFFPRVHKLDDQFEGTWSQATIQLLEGTTVRKTVEDDDCITLYGTTTKYGLTLPRAWESITDPAERELFDRIVSEDLSSETRHSTYRRIENSKILHHNPTDTRFVIFDNGTIADKETGAIGYKLRDSAGTMRAVRDSVKSWETIRRFMMVSCWRESDHDSEVMWKAYARGSYGLAIKTDVKSLASCFITRRPDTIARVEYAPYDSEIIPFGFITPLLFKRGEFGDEHEVRAIITDLHEYGATDGDGDPERAVCLGDIVVNDGCYCDVNPNQLIHEIVVSPFAVPWLPGLLQSVVKKYGLDAPVVRSSLSEKPSW